MRELVEFESVNRLLNDSISGPQLDSASAPVPWMSTTGGPLPVTTQSNSVRASRTAW
ncbi:MAG: hypothetical protein H0T99_01165 [Geodermatophilaceae bacterium]|nr:hypothetical protein [Geodermatophilaceae bacterium]